MKLASLALALLLCLTVHAAPPSRSSIERLLEVTQAEKLSAAMASQVDQMMQAGMMQALAGKDLSGEQSQAAQKLMKSLSAEVRDAVSFEKTKDIYVQVYTETYTQEEVDGLIAFFSTPIGQSYIAKTPQLTQRTAALMQERMGSVMQKVQTSIADAMSDLDAAAAKETKAANPDN